MNLPGFGAALALVVAIGFTIAIVAPAIRRSGLGLVHPIAVWLALEVWFLGVGSTVLAIVEGTVGPAMYLGACLVAAALGSAAAARVTEGWSPAPTRQVPVQLETGRWRWVPLALAVGAVALVLPILARTGMPLLAEDATGARVEIAGLVVQPLRVALPGLVGLLVLAVAARRPITGRRGLDVAVIVAAVGFLIALASRYLAVEMLAVVLITWMLAGRPLPVRALAAAGLGAAIAFVGVGLARAPAEIGADPIASTIGRTASRLFLIQPRTLAALQEAIPAETPYFGGLTWLRQIGPLVGRDDIPNLGYWIYPRVVDGEQAVAGYAAPGLIGEAWANLGPLGIALFAAFGAALALAGELVARNRQRAVDVVAGALVVLFLARTHALGLLGVGVLIALIVGWRLLAARVSVSRPEAAQDRT